MQPSMLEEVVQNPNPYPIVAKTDYPDIWQLCQQARELAWNPAEIDYSDLERADLPPEVRAAGGEWWSLRAWMEHGATPYGRNGCAKPSIRTSVRGEAARANFIMEELRITRRRSASRARSAATTHAARRYFQR